MFANPQLHLLKELLPDFPQTGLVCLVGGAVRDLLLGSQSVDFDFSSEHDPTPLARTFAGEIGGHWFWLDEQRRQSRVGTEHCTFDFSPWRAPTLAGDLSRRDFTINAMAIDMAGTLSLDKVIDPLGGRQDLAARVLRCAGPGVLSDDPLRILRGIRHVVELEVSPTSDCLEAMQTAVSLLAASAPERLRMEIWKILAAPKSDQGIELLVEYGAGQALFGSDFPLRGERIRRSLLHANTLLAALAGRSQFVAQRLGETVEQDLDRWGLLRWWRVFSAISPEQPLMLAHQWRFSRTAFSRIAALRNLSLRSWPELQEIPCRPRPVALWALQHGPDPYDLLLAIGVLQSGGPESLPALLMPYLEALAALPDARHVPPLVDGRWIMKALGVEGAQLGILHAQLRTAEIRGRVNSVEEARNFLLRCFPKKC